MKEEFIAKQFNATNAQIVTLAEQICNNYAAQGYDLSLRQLYYQFIARDLFPNTEQSYKRLGCIISDARLAGLIDWNMITDRGRETVSNNHFRSPAEILEVASKSFRINTWEEQPNHVELMVEKQALEGVLEPVCRRLDIGFTANKGYSSSSSMYEIGKRLQAMFYAADTSGYDEWEEPAYNAISDRNDIDADDRAETSKFYDIQKGVDEYDYNDPLVRSIEDAWTRMYDIGDVSEHEDRYYAAMRQYLVRFKRPHPNGGKNLHVIYLGDHDPSGIDMTRDVKERLELFSRCPVTVHRIALNMDQVRRYNPPENPAKITDSRAEKYIQRFGVSSWELDALEPNLLASLVEVQVLALRDEEIAAVADEKQEAWRGDLKVLADNFAGSA